MIKKTELRHNDIYRCMSYEERLNTDFVKSKRVCKELVLEALLLL